MASNIDKVEEKVEEDVEKAIKTSKESHFWSDITSRPDGPAPLSVLLEGFYRLITKRSKL